MNEIYPRHQHKVAFAIDLADNHTHELGFIPKTAYPRAISEGRLSFAHDSGDLAGFLLHGPLKHVTKIHQACIHPDVRLQQHARTIVLDLLARCAEHGVERLQLYCATDLPSNAFWLQTGFETRGVRPPKSPTSREAFWWEWRFEPGRDIDEFLEHQFKNPTTLKLAEIFGTKERLRRALSNQWRRRKRG